MVGLSTISMPNGSDNRVLSALTDAINRNPNTGAIYNTAGYGYQWQHLLSTTAASDQWVIGVYAPNGSQVTPKAFSVNGLGQVGMPIGTLVSHVVNSTGVQIATHAGCTITSGAAPRS